jgi:hypothetical protein
VKESFKKKSLESRAIDPLKFSLSLFLSQIILPFVNSLIVLLHSLPLWLLIFPSPAVIQVCNLISIYSSIVAGSDKIASIRIYKNGIFEHCLKIFIEKALEITLKISIFLEFIKLNISFG